MNYYSRDTGLQYQGIDEELVVQGVNINNTGDTIIGRITNAPRYICSYEDAYNSDSYCAKPTVVDPEQDVNPFLNEGQSLYTIFYSDASNEELRQFIVDNEDKLTRIETSFLGEMKQSVIMYAFENESRIDALTLFLDYNIFVDEIVLVCWVKNCKTFMKNILHHKNVQSISKSLVNRMLVRIYQQSNEAMNRSELNMLCTILESKNETLKENIIDEIRQILYFEKDLQDSVCSISLSTGYAQRIVVFYDTLCDEFNINYDKQKMVDAIFAIGRPDEVETLIRKYESSIQFLDWHLDVSISKSNISNIPFIILDHTKNTMEFIQHFFQRYTINEILERIVIEYRTELLKRFVDIFPQAVIDQSVLSQCISNAEYIHIPFLDVLYQHYENSEQQLQYALSSELYTELFEESCEYGDCKLAQWIYKVAPHINIDKVFENVFNDVCSSDEIEMALWIVSTNPDKYHVHIQDNDIIAYFIRRELNITKEIEKSDIQKEIEECFICEEAKSTIYSDCGHFYCLPCITKWLGYYSNNSCPYCRTIITSANLSDITQTEQPNCENEHINTQC